jgi:hypothetical protein
LSEKDQPWLTCHLPSRDEEQLAESSVYSERAKASMKAAALADGHRVFARRHALLLP